MKKHAYALGGAGLMLGASLLAVNAQTIAELPDPPEFSAQSEPIFVSISDILEYRALPEYHEPDWVTEKYVDAGTLPPVAGRPRSSRYCPPRSAPAPCW